MALHLVLGLCVYVLLSRGAEGNIDNFDCVGIYEQPSFQHPLLKNHKIPETFSANENPSYKTNNHCPKGTVPILRQKNGSEIVEKNKINGSEVFQVNALDTAGTFGQHFATVETISDGSIYRGAQASISLHNLNLKRNQFSKSQIWIENGPPGHVNSIQAGWAVHPRLYGDSMTRFTIYWTGDGYGKTGCYNLQCPGFVLLSPHPIIGNNFADSSFYGKFSQGFKVQIFQDRFVGNWGLKVFDEVIGYWPNKLFTHLNNGASKVRFGGSTFISPDGISPPMGNGLFPVAEFKKAAHFSNIFILNSNQRRVIIEDKKLRRFVDSENCFKLIYLGYRKTTGTAFTFGGPGGNCGI